MEINKKSIQELADRIETENKLFKLMTKDEKKVVIATDCLIRIQANQLIPYCGMFINNSQVLQATEQPIQSQLNTPEMEIQCEGCAKGSLFLSLIGRVNQFNPSDLEAGNDIYDVQHKKLLEIFTERELAYIELAFEGDQYIKENVDKTEPIVFTQEEITKARQFYSDKGGQHWGSIEDDSFSSIFDENNDYYEEENQGRLIAICENIIENKGQFIL